MKPGEKIWSKSVYEKYLVLDDKSRRLQHYLTTEGHRFDNSRTTKRIKEQLDSFTIRICRRNKDYWLRKNTNHKLATFQPVSFRKMMEYIYQDDGHLLLRGRQL